MRRTVVIVAAAAVALALAGPAVGGQSAKIAALQVALRSHGLYTGAVDGISGPMTRQAVLRFQKRNGIRATGKVGHATRCKLGKLGVPLLGQRQLSRGRVGWDVASLEFRLRRFGLAAKRIDGRFDAATAAALRRFQRSRGLRPDGIAGARTFRALARGKKAVAKKPVVTRRLVHTVAGGRGVRRDRAALSGAADQACSRQRASPDERAHPRPAPAGAGTCSAPRGRRRPLAVRPRRGSSTPCNRAKGSSRSPSATGFARTGSRARTVSR